MSENFKIQDQHKPHFLTSAVVYWIPVFGRDDYFRLLADSLTHCVCEKGLRVHAYVIMPNHWHLVSSQVDGRLSSVIGDMKKFTSKRIAAKLEEDGRLKWLSAMKGAAGGDGVKVWDEGMHPEQIETEAFLRQKVEYVHNNPVKAGYIVDPSDWKYSSAGYYYRDEESIVPITRIEL